MDDGRLYLILANGAVFCGKPFGYEGEVIGEVVFTTGMTGYLETLTDPSYYGQIVVQTFPLIGNYGVIPEDFESDHPHLSGYIVRDWCQEPSNYRSEGRLDTFLKERKIVGLYGIDTRALTRIVREHGVLNGKITKNPEVTEKLLEELRQYKIENAVESVTAKEIREDGPKDAPFTVVLWDFGTKRQIRKNLLKRNCRVITVPAGTTAEEILALAPDGVVLSNGPGDPAENTGVIAEIKKLMETNLPMFGICLGHQLIALAAGGRTEKLKYGHRGGNQPARDMAAGRVYITSQNHGYTVVPDALPKAAKLWYVNPNDGTCEGILYENKPLLSVQFHPEASAGPLDTGFLFDKFIEMMKTAKEGAVCR